MTETLSLFFNAFRHFPEENGERKISYLEVMGLSWALHMITTFYAVFAFYLGIKSYDYLSSSKDFSHLVLDSLNFTLQKWSMMTALFEVVFYPFIFQFAWKFWKGCFKFYGKIFETEIEEGQFEEKTDDILTTAFSSNLLLLLPIAGKVLSNIAMPYFLFTGLKRKLDFTSLQASLVVITPLFLLFLLAIFAATYLVFIITLI